MMFYFSLLIPALSNLNMPKGGLEPKFWLLNYYDSHRVGMLAWTNGGGKAKQTFYIVALGFWAFFVFREIDAGELEA